MSARFLAVITFLLLAVTSAPSPAVAHGGHDGAEGWREDARRPAASISGSAPSARAWHEDSRRPDGFTHHGTVTADAWNRDARRPDAWSGHGSSSAGLWHVDPRRPRAGSFTDRGHHPDRVAAVVVNSGHPFGWKVDPRRPGRLSEPAAAMAMSTPAPGDADGDGVPDDLDRCPRTPRGAWVDKDGCPRDSDGDGVLDGLDKCRNTPKGARVDASGCPKDSDGDGVYDGLDVCPGTPKGVTVDAQGCPEPTSEMEEELLDTGTLRLQDVYFDTNKATIKPESYGVLNEVGEILSRWPQLKIEVGGHTDNRGTEAYNHDLSHRRAQSVRTYLVNRFSGISGDQLTARGYGELRPIATNDTSEGRRMNRRVVFTVLNREVLKR